MTSLNFRKINIEAYKPGRSILKKKKNVIKLSANESALGMSCLLYTSDAADE